MLVMSYSDTIVYDKEHEEKKLNTRRSLTSHYLCLNALFKKFIDRVLFY